MAGLLHDIGFMVNCIAFPKEFAAAAAKASQEQIPLRRSGVRHDGIHSLRFAESVG